MLFYKDAVFSGKVMSVNRREKILQGAMELFFQQGMVTAPVEDIAAALGISKKTIYNHFTNKNEMITETLNYGAAVLVSKMEALAKSKELPYIEKLKSFMEVCVKAIEQRDVIFSSLVEKNLYSNVDVPLLRVKGKILEILNGLLLEGQKSGILNPELSSEKTAYLLFTMISGLVTYEQDAPMPISRLELFQDSLKIVFLGLFTSVGRDSFQDKEPKV